MVLKHQFVGLMQRNPTFQFRYLLVIEKLLVFLLSYVGLRKASTQPTSHINLLQA
jgi:hypothetical protein